MPEAFDPDLREACAGDLIRTRPVADSTDILEELDRAVDGLVLGGLIADFGLDDTDNLEVVLGSLAETGLLSLGVEVLVTLRVGVSSWV